MYITEYRTGTGTWRREHATDPKEKDSKITTGGGKPNQRKAVGMWGLVLRYIARM